jgi:hypothetical protein
LWNSHSYLLKLIIINTGSASCIGRKVIFRKYVVWREGYKLSSIMKNASFATELENTSPVLAAAHNLWHTLLRLKRYVSVGPYGNSSHYKRFHTI